MPTTNYSHAQCSYEHALLERVPDLLVEGSLLDWRSLLDGSWFLEAYKKV
jgi:hypothetical protein